MLIETLSVFPEMFEPVMSTSILGRARKAGLFDFKAYNLRDWTHDRHRTVDDEPYGGGQGMLMKVEPIAEAIEAIVKPCGLGRSKARDISACMRMLRDKYDCNVPDDFDALLELPGVGRKSANLIMGDVFGKPAIVTDTHCIRLCNRIGLVDNIKEPKKVEMALWKIIPPQEGSDFCHRLVDHGRAVCTARTTPYCERCCLRDVCRYAHEEGKAD